MKTIRVDREGYRQFTMPVALRIVYEVTCNCGRNAEM